MTKSSLPTPTPGPTSGADAAQRWLVCEPALERALGPFGNAAITRAGPNPGERVLDVGCGTGGTTMALADAVGPNGHVLGVDISAPLLLRARERAAGRRQIQFLQADAQTAAFARDQDLMFSRFGLMFFSDPLAAFRNLASALKPGGCFTFVCWRPSRTTLGSTSRSVCFARSCRRSRPRAARDPGPTPWPMTWWCTN